MSEQARRVIAITGAGGALGTALSRRLAGFEVLFYEEVEAPEAVARIVARRTSAS